MRFNKKLRKKTAAKIVSVLTAAGLLLPPFAIPAPVYANTVFRGELESVTSAQVDESDAHIVKVSFNDNAVTAKITFLEDGIFRYNVDPTGTFSKYATPRDVNHVAKIPQYPDESDKYTHPEASVSETDTEVVITSGETKIKFNKSTAVMTVLYKDQVVMEEKDGLIINDKATVQTVAKQTDEQFFGGGTQNGRFIHTGDTINIVNENKWENNNVSSPNPFYYTTEGYGILRNTFAQGNYDFGNNRPDSVRAVHNESEYDAYFFLSDGTNEAQVVQDILQGYFKVTGNPVLLPEYGFYEGHLNCYNRDSWSDESGSKKWTWKGSDSAASEGNSMFESGMSASYRLEAGTQVESLNGEKPSVHVDLFPSDVSTPEKYSARAVIDDYETYDMPFGYFLPNDGYGCGYGQNGYRKTGGVEANGNSSTERLAAIEANVNNLKNFTEYARSKGIETGLWTQSNLTPDSNAATEWHLLRDFQKEVSIGGITTLKTDVAWVGAGYSFGLNGVKFAYDTIVEELKYRPNIISLDGWAGSQRFMSVWTGDQYGGNWEYIRFHIPTYIGQSLSGNPNIGSDMDGIFGGSDLIATRDTQWKAFSVQMLNMDGWGSYGKMPYTFGDPYTGISRMYLKLKARMMPYVYTNAAAAANIDTGNEDTGLPMVRAMFLQYPEDEHTYNETAMQYQYMWGENLLIAPIYTETAAKEENGDDVRNGIYLPDKDQIWIDYFTGEQYRGGQTLNNFDAPLWKLPVFVKNGAIIPMYNENNNPSQIDKTKRFVEFWPAGTSSYTVYEDDGKYVENDSVTDADYGVIDNISYGEHVKTVYESKVEGDTATLTAKASTGTYKDYDSQKTTTFIVNVSKEPTSIVAKNGNQQLNEKKVNSKEEFDTTEPEEGQVLYFYDANPSIETYAPEKETQMIAMVADVEVAPKLYVKLAKTNSQENEQTLTINGFANEGNLSKDEENTSLTAPANLTAAEEDKTPTSIKLTWDEVADATSYEVMVDGIVNTVGNVTEFEHVDLEYNSQHTYKVRARNADGYSDWSEEVVTSSKEDPWRNVPDMEIIFTGGDQWGALAHATDHNVETMFHSTGNVVTEQTPVIIDLGAAYELDKFEYYPRGDNYGNGLVTKMDVYTSLDGVHWIKRQDGTETPWTYNEQGPLEENIKTVTFTDVAARYVKLITKESKGGFFSCNELAVHKKDGTRAFAVGSTNKNTTVLDGDYTNMRNYLGTSPKDGAVFVDQIQKRYGDINNNNIYDVYDYAFTMFQLDGGTSKRGNVAGNIYLIPDKETVAAEETFEITVYADSVANLNAFGHVLPYDPEKVEFVSISPSGDIADMEDMNVNKTYEDGTAYYNLAYANRGDRNLFSGSGVLATITMKAKQEISTSDAAVMDLTLVDLIGPDFSLITTDTSETGVPEIFMEIPSSRISAEGLYSEQNTADKAFDGDLGSYWESPYSGGNVGLPKDLVMTLDGTYKVGKLDFISHTLKNGGVTSFDISVSEDGEDWTLVHSGTVDAAAYQQNANILVSTSFEEAVPAKYVKLTVKGAVGRIAEENDRYARIAEIVLYGNEFTGEEMPAVNKQELQTLVNAHADKTQGDYTDDSWTAFNQALTTAQEVLAKEKATQDEVDEAKAALQTAVDGLQTKTPETPDTPDEIMDKSVLQALVNMHKDKTQGNYTDASWKTFSDALKAAQAVLAKEDAVQKEVDAAKTALQNAANSLKTMTTPEPVKVNKATLQTLVNTNKDKKQGNYTDASWKTFSDALKAAQGMLTNTKATQADVDKAQKALQTAINGLEEAEIKEKKWNITDVDVIPNNWKYESVKYVYDREIMGVITNTTQFQPDRPLSRSMFATVLYRMAGEPKVEFKQQFSDVPAGKWYSNAIIWAYQNKIVSGMGDGSFGIDLNITREQIAKMLYEYANVCKYNVSDKKDLSTFTDAKSVSEWAVKYMQWATAVEMITGKPNDEAKTSFRMDPKGEATRAECAAMLMRFANKYVK